jgi:hypothetical protein
MRGDEAAPPDFFLFIYYQLRMGFHPVAVEQYNTQGTPTNHKEHINTLLSNENTFERT